MRLQQYINESECFSTDKWEEMKSILEKDCKPFIKHLKGAKHLLLRGVKAPPSYFKKIKVRTDRKPRLINTDLSRLLDSELYNKFRWKARSEGLFTTTGEWSARVWGKPSIVFPIGEFKYIWMENIALLYYGYDMWGMGTERDQETWDEYILPSIKHYKNTNLEKLLKMDIAPTEKATECIIKCQSYYSINYEWAPTLLKYFQDK